jgi:type VI secretion system protein ImpC
MADSAKTAASAQPAVKEKEALTLNDFIDEAGATVPVNQRTTLRGPVQELVKQIVERSGAVDTSNVSATVAAIIADIDRQLSDQVNKIIHSEKFQKMESAWRGLYHLVNNTESDEMLKIKVFNISKKELTKTFKRYDGAKWDQSPLFKKIYQEEYGTFGGVPFGGFIGDYSFDHSPEDVLTLTGMSQVAAASHAPFIAAASPSLLGFENWQELIHPPDLTQILGGKQYLPWKALRESEDARYLGLTMPRFLARLPYGSKTVPVEEFHFEEDTEGADSSKYSWGNAAYAMGANITRAFKLYGWCTQIRGRESGGTVASLPCHTFPTTDGDIDVKCPTEIAIPDTRWAELSKNGLIPLCYVKNSTDAVFPDAYSLQKAKVYQGKGGAEASTNAQLSARLPYIFATSRFAHYLKCMVRDKIGKMMEKNDVQRFLQEWINNYVLPNPESAGDELKARKPLAGAEVEVNEIEGQPGFYNAVFRLRPHFQLEGVNVSLRLVGKLKQGSG